MMGMRNRLDGTSVKLRAAWSTTSNKRFPWFPVNLRDHSCTPCSAMTSKRTGGKVEALLPCTDWQQRIGAHQFELCVTKMG